MSFLLPWHPYTLSLFPFAFLLTFGVTCSSPSVQYPLYYLRKGYSYSPLSACVWTHSLPSLLSCTFSAFLALLFWLLPRYARQLHMQLSCQPMASSDFHFRETRTASWRIFDGFWCRKTTLKSVPILLLCIMHREESTLSKSASVLQHKDLI